MDSVQKEILEMKSDIKTLEDKVKKLEHITTRHDEQISHILSMLQATNENTTWLKRTITNAIIGAICTGIIGGAFAIFYTSLQQ